MIERRKKKPDGDKTDKPEATAGGTQADPKTADQTGGKPLGNLISQALQFRTKPDKEAAKADEKPKAEAAATEEKPKEEAKPAEQKPAKAKRKADPAVDTGKLVQDVAAATATAVANAIKPGKEAKVDVQSIEGILTDDEKNDLQVIRFMAESEPEKYKDADKKYLAVVKKSQDYKTQWMAANPGKKFNPNDEEHADFYDAVEEDLPYSDRELERAAIRFEAKLATSDVESKAEQRIKKIEREAATTELHARAQNVVPGVFGVIAKTVDEGVFNSLAKDGWEGLKKTDPVAYQEIGKIVKPMADMVQTIIEIDDPKGRIPIDLENPAHKEWAKFITEKENQYVGSDNDDGKLFATRADYIRMSEAQRARHWFLTTETLLTEYAADMAKKVAEAIKSERERIAAVAESLGYTKAGAAPASKQAGGATETKPKAEAQNKGEAQPKVDSPSSSSGSKTDHPATNEPTGIGRVLKATSQALFGR